MDNHIFRSAAWGFNRQDVMEYIERTQKEAEATANALSGQLDGVYAELADLRRQLEECTAREDELSKELEESRQLYEREKTEREELVETSRQQEGSIRTLTEERDRLAEQLEDFAAKHEGVRRDKEKLTQMELDARSRVEDLLEQAHAEAESILAQAKDEAERTCAAAESEAAETMERAESESEALLAAARSESGALLDQTRRKIEDSVRECGELLDACEKISVSIAGELGRLNTVNGRLPGYLTDLKAGLGILRDKAADRCSLN